MDSSDDFQSLQEKIQKALVTTTRTVNSLANEDLSFQRTANPSAAQQLDETTKRLLGLSNRLLRSAAKVTGQKLPSLEEADDVDTYYKSIVDVIDSLLERADTCLDEYTGLVKRKEAPTGENGPITKKPKPAFASLDRNFRYPNLIKPQTKFERRSDNNHQGPWKPLLTAKPHAIIPLAQSLSTSPDEYGYPQYKHPYETEILQLKYPDAVYQQREAIPYLPVLSTTATWVDTYEGVLEMLSELKRAKEIAVDLEHHDYRTYSGLLSLMQISTREKDWIVDTLTPWRHRLEVLNEVFADPSIIKVFHGAFMDIVWLQRDLGLYIVGLFDTHHASDVLHYPARSLAYLLKRFADFDADKKYQLADWRIRPLPEEMFYYARSDTHYLLYIYDMLRNELVGASDMSDPEKSLIEWVLQRSKEVSLSRHSVVPYDGESGKGPGGWYNTLVKQPSFYNRQQFAVYRALHKWRDERARKEDESPHYIMAQKVLSDVARALPTERALLRSLLGGVFHASQVIDELLALVATAMADGANGPSLMQFLRGDDSVFAAKTYFAKTRDAQPQKTYEPAPDVRELRATQSQFWGPVAVSSVWEGSDAPARIVDAQDVALPWTVFVQALEAAQAEELPGQPQQKAVADVEGNTHSVPQAVGNFPPQDREFTLRAGRKRKVSDTAQMTETTPAKAEAGTSDADSEDESGPQGAEDGDEMDISTDVDDLTAETIPLAISGEPPTQKKKKKQGQQNPPGTRAARRAANRARDEAQQEAKRARKAAKLARRAEKKAVGDAASAASKATADAPFDYTQAESLLQRNKPAGNGAPAAFDPYAAKTQASMPGARKHNYEKAGKTATFKS